MGNIAAGYIAGINGISWKEARVAFDTYQVKTAIKGTISKRNTNMHIGIEGISTRNAEYFGWRMGYANTSLFTRNRNLINSIKSAVKSLFGF